MKGRLKLWTSLLVSGLILAGGTSLAFHWMYPEAALVREGRRAYSQHRYLEAAAYFAAAREQVGDDTRFHRRELQARLAAGDLDGARLNLSFLAEHTGNPDWRRQLAGILQALGEPRAAIEQWDRVLASQPNDLEAHFQKASATLQSGDMELAEVRFREVLSVRADHPGALLALGKLMAWRGALPEAEELLRGLLGQFPAWLEARVYLARVLSWQGLWEDSVDEYRQALRLFTLDHT